MNTELNLLPFNLEEALKNPERVVYRNGEKPLEWHWFEKADQSGLCVCSYDLSNDINTHFIDGSYHLDKSSCKYDLFITPKP